MILGNPFIVLIELFTIDSKGIHTTLQGRHVMFRLEMPKQKTLINTLNDKIKYKSTHLKSL